MKKENKKVLADLIKEYGDIKMILMHRAVCIQDDKENGEYNKECRVLEDLKLDLSKVVSKLKKDFGIEI